MRAAEPLDQPQLDELEVSVFGRGVGECIVAHVGGATWLVVDSHRVGDRTSPPVALEYLAAIGVPSEVVALVAATHWDRDHIAGLSEVVEECTEADFMCTGAIHDPEFFRQLALVARHEGPLGPGAKEFRSVLEILDRRGRGVLWANRLSALELASGELRALAPSELTQTMALRRGATGPGRLPSEPTPNDSCLVLWYQAEQVSFLLGADLEAGAAGTGWEGVLERFSPRCRASVFKVAHHGSEDAHHSGIWHQLLAVGPDSIVTPYSPARRPRVEDVDRLRSLSTAHFTGPEGGGRVRRSSHVERMVQAHTVGRVRRRVGPVGHVRLRRSLAAEATWEVSYNSVARSL
ncbi:MAG TPA: hypothetical protein VI006_01180 [Solirubrobacteraceae bacterium]